MRTTAPSPAILNASKTGLSLKIVHENEPVRSPSSTPKKALPFDAVFEASFFTTSMLAKGRPCAVPSSALRSRTIKRGISAAMALQDGGRVRFHKLGVRAKEGVADIAEQCVEDSF